MSFATSARLGAARAVWRATGYTMVGEPLNPGRAAVYVGAPHTSYWDFVLAVAVLWQAGLRAKVLVKKSVMDGPLGPLMRALGAARVDRENPGHLIADLVEEARHRPDFGLVLAPEGTRAPTDGWKSGFYRIALAAGLPVVPISVDGPTKEIRVGRALDLTGDTRADMDVLRDFFAGARGVKPGSGGPVRLRDEDQDFRSF